MNDNRTAMAAAVAGGYLLGRTKKAKLAFAVGSYLVGRRAGLSPGRLLGQGLGGLQRTPQVQELTDQVRGDLLTAGRAAVTAAANRRLTGFADTLRDRTDALSGESRRNDYDDHEDSGDSWDEQAPDEDAYFDGEDREEDRRPAPAPPRKTAKKAPPRKAAPPAKKPAKKAATAKKAAPVKRSAGRSAGRGGGRG
ncbi:hypothetical protein M4J06_002414 [Streptomyces coelicoflavus]|uniref:hypothetical protein n=1 Tax=Streptomyces coelicoflavus TaxID=285562 RepID=UPI00210B9674|nr:hypothetical protein [Streptomyces coelicoflavus]MCQ4199816.1 hypothetical protein [Streptomyces coelicoflavus]